MKLTTTQETTLRKIASSVVGVGGVIGSTINLFLKGALGTVIALVVFGLMTANHETATFGDFLRAIQSPALAGVGLIGGLLWVGLRQLVAPK